MFEELNDHSGSEYCYSPLIAACMHLHRVFTACSPIIIFAHDTSCTSNYRDLIQPREESIKSTSGADFQEKCIPTAHIADWNVGRTASFPSNNTLGLSKMDEYDEGVGQGAPSLGLASEDIRLLLPRLVSHSV